MRTIVALVLVVTACIPAGDTTGPESASSAPTTLPPLDLGTATADPSDIFFDTFDGGTISLADADPATIERLRDAIPPLDDPPFVPGGDTWPDPEAVVLGYVADDGVPYAFPVNILNFHEIVNATLGGRPVLVSYCPLCRSGIVYDRTLDGRVLSFGNTSALYESDLVMYDRQTNSYWWQVAGRAIVGTLTGAELTPLSSTMTRWGRWRDLHPDTLVLSRDTGFRRDYDTDPFAGYADHLDSGRFPFPVSDAAHDRRLPPSTVVLAVDVGGSTAVYPLTTSGAVDDDIGDEAVVVFVLADEPTGAAYRPIVDGRRLTFGFDGREFFDRETRSTWGMDGRARRGPLTGTQLDPLPSRTTFWFALVAAFPDLQLRTVTPS